MSEVKAQYPQLKITQAPRGGSLDDETVFTSVSAWGEISFGFKEKIEIALLLLFLNQRIIYDKKYPS
ncbi:hypothetical protein RCN32_17045 [Escherichia marmotae]|uniref:hypothetical protein n=1 Tax=Escherichia TaxID=561 RepID=UPI000F834016|nr:MULTISPECIES: hypothetical protein [Escherichia]EGD4401784.1 hypothetical protein [Escherichia coli]MDZ5484334.1 hypothetical protein [Escherichia marmotae]MEC9684071.1 hypothetical protein [Escherichia marmotae]MEC9703792.1 hypothetical protein [Escherichia marmotae]MEC9707936.1 hypothetical protein [Escherichia marmotae]